MNWDKWVWDVSMPTKYGKCLCPVEMDEDGEVTSVVVGMNFIGDKPPQGTVIGLFHDGGNEAVEAWMAANPDWRERL